MGRDPALWLEQLREQTDQGEKRLISNNERPVFLAMLSAALLSQFPEECYHTIFTIGDVILGL